MVTMPCRVMLLGLLIMTLPTARAAFAQTSMGAVEGTVTDSTGSVIPGVTVTLTNQATNIQTARVSNDRGYFTFVNVRPGTYTIAIELQGFKTAQIAPFTVGVNETVARNARLDVGSLNESVTVVGQSELLQTSTATLGNVVEEKVIRELPTQGRNFTSLLMLSPGVNPVSTAQGPGANGSNETGFGTEGNSGIPGGVVNMTSKSGSNRFNGSAVGFFRNENFTARNPFRDEFRDKAPVFRQGQYGANLGGPIAKDRTFFFGSYDGWSYRDVQDLRSTVPAAGELDGDFSQTFHGRTIYNPFTTRIVNGKLLRDPFPGNVVPKELISPTMQAFLKAYMVKPTLSGSIADNFRNSRERTSKSNSFQARIDHHFSASDNLFFRWTERHINNVQPVGDLGFNTRDSINRNIGGGLFHSFSSNVIMEVRGGIATQPTEDAPLEHPLGIGPQQRLGLPELDRFAGYIVAGLNTPWTGMPNLGVQGPRPRENPNWNAAADLTWLRGNHNYKGGFQMLQIGRLQRNQFGQLNFSAEATRDPQNPSRTGDALASTLLGIPSRIQGFVPDLGFIDFHTSTLSGYVQDQWSLRPDVTLTYGLRYDYITRVIGQGLQSGPDMNTGEWLLALRDLPGVCSGQAPPCLPASFDVLIVVVRRRG